MLKLLIFRCTRCSETGAHSDHFLLHINNAFRSERPPRRQAAAGAGAKGAGLAFILLNEGVWAVSEMCSALKVTRQGYYAWRRRPPSAHDPRDAELAG